MSSNAAVAWLRRVVVPHVIPLAIGGERLRTFAFRFVSEIGIAYRDSTLATEGEPALSHGPRAGERLPDAPVRVRGQESTLQREVVGACFTLLVCERGARGAGTAGVDDGRGRGVLPADLLRARRLVSPEASTGAEEELVDDSGVAFERLGVRDSAIYLVRPDGYVAYRCAGTDLEGVDRWIEEALAT
jgi:hypothetical protein